MKYQRPIAVDLFAGAGGMSLGFEQAGFDVLASVEIDPIHCATHSYNFPFRSIICRSITEIGGEEIRQLSNIGDRDIDVVFGGPPCQGFSLMGKRTLDDPRNSLIEHFLRIIIELQPKYFVMENVKGMTVGKHRIILEETIEKFSRYNYKVESDYRILNAADYGVPQNRERLFLIGCRDDRLLPNYPEPTTHPGGKNNLQKTPTVLDALRDLPEVERYAELLSSDRVKIEYGEASDYGKLLRGLQGDKNDYSYGRKYDSELLTSSARTRHTPESISRFKDTERGKIEPISKFYKLSPDGLCNTLRAGTPTRKGAYTAPRPIHYETPRCITVREAARLHSYPDWFRFHATKWHGFRQIGNSVPPLLARAIAAEIIRVLNIKVDRPLENYLLEDEYLLIINPRQAAKMYGVDSKIAGTRIRPVRG